MNAVPVRCKYFYGRIFDYYTNKQGLLRLQLLEDFDVWALVTKGRRSGALRLMGVRQYLQQTAYPFNATNSSTGTRE
ncbi:hypothetical protein BH11BAC5_BH11BAC5_05770 [soil metagenome]